MRAPPPISELPRYPVVAVLLVGSLAVSGVAWLERDPGRFVLDERAFGAEPWRLATSVLVHGDPIHFLFNAVWIWLFGTLIEEVLGHARTAGLALFLGVGSGAAEYAIQDGGIGLSGIVYGFFSLLYVGEGADRRFRDVVDPRTLGLFLGWFLFAIAATEMGLLRIANVAHAIGGLQGVLVGEALAGRGRGRRLLWWGLAAALTAASLAAAVRWRAELQELRQRYRVGAAVHQRMPANVRRSADQTSTTARNSSRAILPLDGSMWTRPVQTTRSSRGDGPPGADRTS